MFISWWLIVLIEIIVTLGFYNLLSANSKLKRSLNSIKQKINRNEYAIDWMFKFKKLIIKDIYNTIPFDEFWYFYKIEEMSVEELLNLYDHVLESVKK